jgi:signal transduction histidine kinase
LFARRQSHSPDLIDVEKFVYDLVDMLRQMASSLNVKTQIADSLWPPRADQDQLMRSIVNIAIDARDAMLNGGVLTIDVRNAALRNGPDDDVLTGDFIAFAISDTGVGMEAETLQHAFEAFFTTKSEGMGWGLGLNMVAGFIKQWGGAVRINSEIGCGTSVTISLPRANQRDSVCLG